MQILYIKKIPHIREQTPGCLRCSTVFSFIWHISFKSGISRKKEIGCLRPIFYFSTPIRELCHSPAKICNQNFVQKLSMASFFLTQKVQTLEATQPGTSEPFHPSVFSAPPSLSPIPYAPTTLFITDCSLETSCTFKFHAICCSFHFTPPFPSSPNTLQGSTLPL